MLLFLGTFHYYASFNGMRQYMVAAVLFLCHPSCDQWSVEIVFSACPRMFIVSFIGSHHDSCVFYRENKIVVLDDAGFMHDFLRVNRSL